MPYLSLPSAKQCLKTPLNLYPDLAQFASSFIDKRRSTKVFANRLFSLRASKLRIPLQAASLSRA